MGRPVDRRSDIFSFGAVLYEMLTGKRAFAGATTPDVLEAVVKNDPDWSKLPAGHAGVFAEAAGADAGEGPQAATAGDRRSADCAGEPGARTGIGIRSFTVESRLESRRDGGTDSNRAHCACLPQPPRNTPRRALATSVNSASRQVSGWRFGSVSGWEHSGTPLPRVPKARFGSAISILSICVLLRTPTVQEPRSGPPTAVPWVFRRREIEDHSGQRRPCDGPMRWRRRRCLESRGSDSFRERYPPYTGAGERGRRSLRAGHSDSARRAPSVSKVPPRRQAFSVSAPRRESRRRWHLPGRAGPTRGPQTAAGPIQRDLRSARKAKSHGHLLFQRESTLMAQPFDADTLQLAGDVRPVASQLSRTLSTEQVAASAAGNGTLVYLAGSSRDEFQLTWLDRSGNELGRVGPVGYQRAITLSPDQKTVALGYTRSARGRAVGCATWPAMWKLPSLRLLFLERLSGRRTAAG